MGLAEAQFVMFVDSKGNRLLAMPNTTYFYKGTSYISMEYLPKELLEEIHGCTTDFHGFSRFGNCINTSYIHFDVNASKNGIKYLNKISNISGDKRLIISIGEEDLMLIDENLY